MKIKEKIVKFVVANRVNLVACAAMIVAELCVIAAADYAEKAGFENGVAGAANLLIDRGVITVDDLEKIAKNEAK